MHIQNFATLVNTAVPIKEMIHHGGTDFRYNNAMQFNFKELSKDQCVQSLLASWYISPSQSEYPEHTDDNDLLLSCMVEGYINLCVRSQLKKHELEEAGLTSILNDDLFVELCQAYEEELNVSEHLTSRKVKYYKSASYTIVDNDDNDQIDVKLKVGDVIDVLEDLSTNDTSQETTTRVSYARIRAIFLHTNRNYQVPFFFLDWFIAQDTIDRKLKCPIYKLQHPSDYTWRRIYAIKWLDHQPNIHFVLRLYRWKTFS
ncbi:unnamed protein product [Rhizophagus irregularis]|nr:unnamed protein product [Rhizophagus irregularis]